MDEDNRHDVELLLKKLLITAGRSSSVGNDEIMCVSMTTSGTTDTCRETLQHDLSRSSW